jgi:hypothetical protein
MKISSKYLATIGLLAVVVIASGCNTMNRSSGVTYSFDPAYSFTEAKTYSWSQVAPRYGQNALVEANVRFLTDRDFEGKGLKVADGPALLAWVGYESDYYSSGDPEVRILTLNVARADTKALVWQGRARGNIRTDAASDELKKVVGEMLGHFPPK